MNMFKSIAIDGPAGAGKSDVSSILAKKLGFIHVDTGAFYRAVARFFVSKNINESFICSGLNKISIDVKFINDKQIVLLNGKDVASDLRTEEVTKVASKISSFECVRNFLLSIQRRLANSNNVVMDGRDISTVVLPNADVKIFLTASVEERAKRRFKQMADKGINCVYADVKASIIERDTTDSSRNICPLKPSEGSIIYDTTGKTIDGVINDLLKYIEDVL